MVRKSSLKRVVTIAMLISMIFSYLPLDVLASYINEKLDRMNIVDQAFLASSDPNVVDKFRPLAKQLTEDLKTGTASASTDPANLEYSVSVGPIIGSTAASYNYVTIFNPATSGKTAVIKKMMIQTNASSTAAFQDIRVRRISAASAGTLIAATSIPKKNELSVDSAMEIRYANVTATLSGSNNSNLMAVVAAGAAGTLSGTKEITFGSADEKLVLQPGEGIVVHQIAAGNINQKIRFSAEWEEQASPPVSQNEFMIAYPRVEVAATANYKYATFFNPAASGKTAIVKRIWLDVDADTTAVYTNNIFIQRISAASLGTAIAVADVPKLNSASANSVMDLRYTGVTATVVGTANSQLMAVNPPGAASQPHGHQEIAFKSGDEKLILQPGEGIAVISAAAGDIDQLVRLSLQWDEETVAPASAGEYMLSIGPVPGNTAATYNFASFFNPAASGKTAVIKRLSIRVNATTTGAYNPFYVQRITAASAGTQIVVTDVPKMHSGSANSIMDIRRTNPTVTLLGTDGVAKIMGVTGPGAVGQMIGIQETVFDTSEKLILQPGEGIVLRQNAAGAVGHNVRFLIEWGEQATAPPTQGEYMTSIGPVSGSIVANYNYMSFFNPATSGKTAVVRRVALRIDAAGTAAYVAATLRRSTAASGGTLIAATDIVDKHSATANSAMELRHTGVTVTLAGTANSRIDTVVTPGAVGAATAPHLTGYNEFSFGDDEKLILQPGEGIAVYQEAAGNANFRVRLLVEWDEEAVAPASQGEFLVSSPVVNGVTTAGYVYASYYNPAASGKTYVVKRLGIRAIRAGTLTAPGYLAVTARKITTSTAGTLVAAADIPKKHSGTANSTAELRYGGPTVTLEGTADSRVISLMSPGAVGQQSGIYETFIVFQDEMVLAPGEGIALYQETNAGDVNMRYLFKMEWTEASAAASPTLTVGATAGSQVAGLDSGAVSQYLNTTTCTSPTDCAAFTLSLSTGTETVTSIKITQIGTVNATTTLSNAALFYDTDGNYSNGVTGQFGTTVASFTAGSATISGSLSIAAGTTYYLYVRVNLANGATYPSGGQTIDFQIAQPTDVGTSGTPTKTGPPIALAGSTTVRPVVTGYTNSTEAGLNYSASCTTCGARIGPALSTKSQTVVISGYGFGSDPGAANRASAANKIEVGTKLINTNNVTAWSNTSVTLITDTANDSDTSWGTNFGGASALKVTAGSQAPTTSLNFYIFPQVTGIRSCDAVGFPSGDNAREYSASDATCPNGLKDGEIYLDGTRFGTASTGGYVRILGCSATTCSAPADSATTTAWSNTLITVQIPTVIANNSYTGSVAMQQGTGSNNKTHTYTASGFRILPRIVTTTPGSGSPNDAITITGDHLCQTGTCPSAFNASNAVTFFNGQTSTVFTSWSDSSIVTAIPTAAADGNLFILSNNYPSNNLLFSILSPIPLDPTNLNQYSSSTLSGPIISIGGAVSTTPIYFTGTMQAEIPGGTIYFQVEYKPVGVPFACTTTTTCASAIEGLGKTGPGPVDCSNPANACFVTSTMADGIYHWQARVRHNKSGINYYSNWISFGGNAESATDFQLDKNGAVITFPNGDTCSGALGTSVGTNGATISWSTNEGATGQVEYGKNTDLTGNLSAPVPPASLNTTFAIPLANLDSNSTYYFRVKTVDPAGSTSYRPTTTPYCSFLTGSVNQPAKTTVFFINGFTSAVSSFASSSFKVDIPETTYSIKSAYVEITGISPSAGTNNITIGVNSEPALTYVVPGGDSSFKIIYPVQNLNLDPLTNELDVSPTQNTNIISAKIIVTYAYTP